MLEAGSSTVATVPKANRHRYKLNGKWCYLYRGMDEYGDYVDSMLSETRDMAAAKAFFQQA